MVNFFKFIRFLYWLIYFNILIDEITRDYLYGIKDEKLRKAKLIPFLGMFDNEEDDDVEDEDKIYNFDDNPTDQDEPDINYFRVYIIYLKVIEKSYLIKFFRVVEKTSHYQ